MKDKPKLIILEGPDKVGKTTIYQLYRKATNYGPLIIDRFIGSNFSYDMFFSRKHYIKNYSQLEKDLMKTFDCYLIYLFCSDYTVLRERMSNAGEDISYSTRTKEGIEYLQNIFNVYFLQSKFKHTIRIDTSIFTIKETLEEILKLTGEKDVRKDKK